MHWHHQVVIPIKTHGVRQVNHHPTRHCYLPVTPSSLQPAFVISVYFLIRICLLQLTARCYSSLRRIKKGCRRALTRSASVILDKIMRLNSFIVSKLDYCNSLFAGCGKQLVDKLQLSSIVRLEWSLVETVELTLLHYYATNSIGSKQESGLRSNFAY